VGEEKRRKQKCRVNGWWARDGLSKYDAGPNVDIAVLAVRHGLFYCACLISVISVACFIVENGRNRIKITDERLLFQGRARSIPN